MSRESAERIMGPSNRDILDTDDENQLICEYSDAKITLSYYKNEDGKLGYIRSSNSELLINDLNVIDKDVNEVLTHVDSNLYSWEEEEYELFKTYFHQDYWLTLNVEYNRVISIELGVPFRDDNHFDWPD